jgi:hypothetical protein
VKKFKVGDKVRYIQDYSKLDKTVFSKGNIYTVWGVVEGGVFVVNKTRGLLFSQIELVTEDNAMNRLLFLELKPDGKGYLV